MADRLPPTMVRYTVHFSGRVQGVGFRYTAIHLATDHEVAGYVRNLPDGRVRLVVEGSGAAIEAFVESLKHRMGAYIQRTDVQTAAATGEFGRPAAGAVRVRY